MVRFSPPARSVSAELEAQGSPPARLVQLRGVAVDVERSPVLRELDLDVFAGEALGLVGANGSGKSTLLSVLATLSGLRTGTGSVLGARLGTQESAAVRPRIALVGHAPALYPQLTLQENLRFLARLVGRPDRAADTALDAVGLARAVNRRADRCSQGMQRRADLARVLLTEPMLLLLDEVHTGLDAASVGMVDDLIEQARGRAGAAVVVSHDHNRLGTSADRVVEIVDGRAATKRADAAAGECA